MAERLSAEQATRLERRVTAAERRVTAAKAKVDTEMAARALVFLDCFDAGLTIPEIAAAASKSPAMVSIALADARKVRGEDQQAAESA